MSNLIKNVYDTVQEMLNTDIPMYGDHTVRFAYVDQETILPISCYHIGRDSYYLEIGFRRNAQEIVLDSREISQKKLDNLVKYVLRTMEANKKK